MPNSLLVQSASDISSLPPGTVVATKVYGVVDHVGVLGDFAASGGERLVYSNSRRWGRGTAETVSSFADGSPVWPVKYPPSGRECEIVRRAQVLASTTRRWSLADNCEHFVSRAYGETPRSPQMERLTGLLAVAAVVALVVVVVSA